MANLEVRVVRHQRSGRHRGRIRMRLLVSLLFAATVVITWQFARRPTDSDLSHPASEGGPAPLPEGQANARGAESFESTAFTGELTRPVYPYSVVRGGVYSLDELRRVVEHDSVVARHFQGFDFQRAHLVRVSASQTMYVSYRIGDRVYWTRRKIRLHPGETLITDGKILVRARCGNRVANVPLDSGSPLEPSEEELEEPYSRDMVAADVVPPAVPPAPTSSVATASTGHEWWFTPWLAAPLAALPGAGGSSHEPLAVAPEPGTMLLLSSGLAAVYWRSRKFRRKD